MHRTAPGHPCGGKSQTPVDWRTLAKLQATLCIYMGTQRFVEIARELRAGGLADTTSVAIVAGATLSSQTVRIGTLADGAELLDGLQGRPALILVGEVVRWSELVRAADEFALASCEI